VAEPDREVMVVTHAYLSAAGELANDTTKWTNNTYLMDATSNNGEDLWNKYIRKCANIRWVFNGHYLTPPTGGSPYRNSAKNAVVGDNGNLINQVFVNFQEDFNGGNGFFFRLLFKPSEGTVTGEYYSPYLSAYDTVNASFTLNSPSITSFASVGVSGDLSAKRIRTEQLKVEAAKTQRIMFSGADGLLTTSDKLQFNYHPDSVYKFRNWNTENR
jgi:hypothetical protein